MKISIWDLDYYFAEDKTDLVNPDVQKISSYHKQNGDKVNFVLSPYDINRPYDIYYIIKERAETPNPPLEWMINPKVRWWGKAYRMKKNWKMPDVMLACRPDYLLYPNRETRLERAEHIRLIGNSNNLLPITQDWSNTFKDKHIIVDDKDLWVCDSSTIVAALERIKHVKSVCFAEPIWIEKIRTNPDIEKAFFNLQLSRRSMVLWSRTAIKNALADLEWLGKFREKFPFCPLSYLPIYMRHQWTTTAEAQEGLEYLKKIIKYAKYHQIFIQLKTPKKRENTPFFFLPELFEQWTNMNFKVCWLEFLSYRYVVGHNVMSGVTDWNKPNTWPPLFRDALRQTYTDKEFLLLQWGDEKMSDIEIPWNLWEETFKYGL